MYILFLDEVVEKVTFGTTQESYTKKKHFPHKAHRRHYRSEIFMTPQKDLENPTSFGVAETKENSSDMSDPMDITKAGRENIQSYLNPFQSGNETHPGTVAGDKGTSIPFLSESALYRLYPEETATYLVETDPAFTNKHRFLSSDYMYRQMTWDPDRVTKRLGDGFYEQELVRQQIAGLTGIRYLNGYTDDEEEYKALMDAGIAYAKEYNLKPGISLTKEQMASLTSDMVWLETTTVTVHGKTYEVLYPKVYLKPGNMTLTADGSLISADTLVAETKETLENNASILGNTVVLKGNDVVNLGKILGKDISLRAERDITQKGLITGEDRAALTAGRDISMGNTIFHGKNQDILDTTAGIAVKGKEGVLLMESGRDIHLTGATLADLGDKGSMILSTGHNLTMDTDALEARKDMTEDRDNYIRTYRKTETTNTLTAGRDITMTAGNNIKARNTAISSENGTIGVKAGNDVTVENGFQKAADDYGLKYKESGFLSHKNTGFKSHDESKAVTGSLLSGDTVTIVSAGNTEVTASNIVGTNDVSIVSGKDTTITSAEEVEKHDYEKRVKKSGLLGGGLGFTIGSEKRNDQYKDADITQKGSTIGSIAGNVTIEANKDVHVNASDIIAGKDISLTGENVDISSKDNVYHSDEKHEYKKSGLTVAVGGAGINAIESVAAPATRMTQVSDNRLKALYGYETAEKIKKNGDALKNIVKGKLFPTISIGIGSSSSKSERHSTITEAQGSSLQTGQDVTIKTKEGLSVIGSDILGNNVTLDAGKDIRISATKEKEKQKISQSSKGGSLGVSLSAGSVVSVDSKFYAGKGKENSSTTSYKESTVTANDTLTMKSGKDISFIGSTASGNKVKADVGRNLDIESVQTKKEYNEENASAGMSFGTSADKTSYGGSASKGNMKSNYESVTDQAAIRAGGDGFDISVKENTNLKGGIIDSDATKDKNTLTTGTLTWEDMDNKADYSSIGMGVSHSHYGDYDQMTQKQKNEVYNKKGLTPSISSGAKGKSNSTTNSAVAAGTIKITDLDKQKQKLADLNRNAKNSLHQLGEIFDNQKIEEREEMAGLFGRIAYNAIHDMKDGTKKTAMHALTGGIMSKLSNGNFLAGATSATVNKMLMDEIKKASKGDPATMEWMSAIVGGITTELVSVNSLIGASVASSATKNNSLRDAIDAINGIFDANEAYEEAKADDHQKISDDIYESGAGEEESTMRETGDVEVNTTDIAKNIEDKAAETYGEPLSDSMDEEEYESNNESFDETPQLPHENGPTSDDAFSAWEGMMGSALDNKSMSVTGKVLPVGTTLTTTWDILNDARTDLYGVGGSAGRIRMDFIATGASLSGYLPSGKYAGIIAGAAMGVSISKLKDYYFPELPESKRNKEDQKIYNEAKNSIE